MLAWILIGNSLLGMMVLWLSLLLLTLLLFNAIILCLRSVNANKRYDYDYEGSYNNQREYENGQLL